MDDSPSGSPSGSPCPSRTLGPGRPTGRPPAAHLDDWLKPLALGTRAAPTPVLGQKRPLAQTPSPPPAARHAAPLVGAGPEGSMSHGCRARAETPLGAIALGTTPLHGCWPAVQVTPAAGRGFGHMSRSPSGPPGPSALLSCLCSSLTTPRLLLWPFWPCSLLSGRSPCPRPPRRGGRSLIWRCWNMARCTRRAWTCSPGRPLSSPRSLLCGAAYTPPSSRAARSEAGCGTGRSIYAAPRPRPTFDASPAAPPTGWLGGGALCSGGPGLRRRSQRRRLRPRELRPASLGLARPSIWLNGRLYYLPPSDFGPTAAHFYL